LATFHAVGFFRDLDRVKVEYAMMKEDSSVAGFNVTMFWI